MSCMTIFFLNFQITRSDIRPNSKWVVSLVTAYGHFNLPQGFVWVYMALHTHVITPEGDILRERPNLSDYTAANRFHNLNTVDHGKHSRMQAEDIILALNT